MNLRTLRRWNTPYIDTLTASSSTYYRQLPPISCFQRSRPSMHKDHLHSPYIVLNPSNSRYLLCVESCGEPIVIFIWLLIFSALMCCLYSFGVRCISECLWNGRLNSVYVMWQHEVCTLCTIFLSSITIFSASVNILNNNAKIMYVIIKKK